MNKLQLKDISEVINDYDIFLFDLWGVIIEGGHIYPGVVDNINKVIAQKKVFFVTNAPRRTYLIFKQIQSWGINVTPEMVISAGGIAIDMILESNEKFNIASPIIYHLNNDQNDLLDGIQCVTTTNIQEANILLLTMSLDENENINLNQFDDLLKISIKRNILNLCANPDLGISQQGIQRYCAGYFATKLLQFGGQVTYAGKPYTEIYNKILNQIPNVPKKRIVMIGDTFYTDILGANQMNIDSALVLTGNAKKFHIQYSDINQKLIHLQFAAIEANVTPNFVIKLDS